MALTIYLLLSDSGRLFDVYFSYRGICLPVADRKVVGSTTSFKLIAPNRIEISDIVFTNGRISLASDVHSKVSGHRTAVSCSNLLGILHLTRVRGFVGAWTGHKSVVLPKSCDLVSKLWGSLSSFILTLKL